MRLTLQSKLGRKLAVPSRVLSARNKLVIVVGIAKRTGQADNLAPICSSLENTDMIFRRKNLSLTDGGQLPEQSPQHVFAPLFVFP